MFCHAVKAELPVAMTITLYWHFKTALSVGIIHMSHQDHVAIVKTGGSSQ